MKKYFYLNDEQLKKGYPCVVEMTESPISDYENRFLQKGLSVREYIGESLPERLVYDSKTRIVREATEQEKYNLSPDTYQLREETYYIKNGLVKELPEKTTFYLKPFFDIESEAWVERANGEELKNYEDTIYKEFYYSELNDFSKATNEYNATVMSEDDYKECQEYIRNLASQLNSTNRIQYEKPEQMK